MIPMLLRAAAAVASLAVLLSTRLPGQDQASTLALLVDRAAAIARLRAVQVASEPGGEITVRFLVERVLTGTPPSPLDLVDAEGRGCGRSLTGVVPGQRFLAFLARGDGGWRLCTGGARALVPAVAAVEEHVSALVRTAPAARAGLLAAALDAPQPRVRVDAALTLPLLPAAAALDAAAGARVVGGLAVALDAGDDRVVPLLAAAVRYRLTTALDVVLPRYLEGGAAIHAEAIVAAARDLDPAAAAAGIAARLPADLGGRRRALTLLEALPTAAAAAPLQVLLEQAASLGDAGRAGAALLRLGAAPETVAARTDRAGLELAQRLAGRSAPRLRWVRPGGRAP